MSTPESILVADGSRDCADAVAMLLAASGMHPAVAYDAPTALSLGKAQRFDAAVMDITIPGASPFAVARELRRARGPSIRLVAYTAWPASYASPAAAEGSFDEVISKVSEPGELLRAVSPAFYADLVASMCASAEHVRLEIELGHSLLDQASICREAERREALFSLVQRRLAAMEQSMRKMVLREHREPLRLRLEALRARLRAAPRG